MAKEDIINATLLTTGVAFVGEAIKVLSTNVLTAIILVAVGLGIFYVREILP